MSERNATTANPNDFEFDCPQFTDFSAVTVKSNDDISEEFCQNYFDKKREEIKRSSSEFKVENMEIDAEGSNTENDECNSNTSIPNLVSPAQFGANMSSVSSKSSNSSHHSHSHNHNSSGQKLRFKHTNSQLTTEQRQINAIEHKRKELAKIKAENAKRVAKMRDDQYVFQPIRSTKLTIPITPALHTSKRARKRKTHICKAKNANLEKENMDLRLKQKRNSKPLKPTVPQSFKLSKTKKRRTDSNSKVLSTEQKQLREMEKHNFTARKINPKIFKANGANLGILNNVKNKMSTTTQFVPFNLMTEKRAKKHKINEKSTRKD